jgi:L-asparaginase
MPEKSRVLMTFLGGTISMMPSHGSGIVPSLSGKDLVQGVPALNDIADIVARTPFNVPSSSLTLDELVQVAHGIDEGLEHEFDGVVVVQGTDSIEETAFSLELLVRSDKPVVVTGAMRGGAAPGADGPANLIAAATVAASREAGGIGTMVVLNDEIHAARFVQKVDTCLPSAFGSPDTGRIGAIIEGESYLYMRPDRLPTIQLPQGSADVPVGIVKTFAGDDGRMLSRIDELGYKGVVIEGLGAGHVPDICVHHVQALIDRGIFVVISSRVPGGRVFRSTYGYPGSEIDLLRRGIIPAGQLSSVKARILLSLLLRSGETDPMHGFRERT